MEPVILDKLDIEIDYDEVVRLLGSRGDGSGRLNGKVEKAIEDAFEEAYRLIEPRGMYLIAAGSDLPGSTIFRRLERMAFCICTIGPGLEKRVSELSARGELLGAVILDSVGSAAAEAVARRMDEAIQESAAAEGLKTSCRASPGYGDWDIREQKGVFGLLDGSLIGVSLSESSMMIPRKSISFAVHIADKPVKLRSENSCDNCDMEICPYRRDEG